jgi:hypothetical protein
MNLTFFFLFFLFPSFIWNAANHINSKANIGPRTNPGTAKKSYGSGKETLRLRANGPARVEEAVSIIISFKQFPFSSFSLSLPWNRKLMSRCLAE